MIREIRKVKNRTKQYYIRSLIDRKKISKLVKNGFVAYDTEELEEFKKVVKRGRPIKINEEEI